MVKYDLSNIPAGSQVITAALSFYVNSYSNENLSHQPIAVCPISTNWIESAVTWNSADTDVPWSTPGGDFEDCVDVATTSEIIAGDWLDLELPLDTVQQWLDNSELNFGVLIKLNPDSYPAGNESAMHDLFVAPSENEETEKRPVLGVRKK